MSELKIRAIRDVVNEANTVLIGIDKFDNIDPEHASHTDEDYYCAVLALDYTGKPIKNPKIEWGKQSFEHDGYNGMLIHCDDVFNPPSPQLYMALGQALKNKGYIFNKKKCRFQKVNP